MITPRPPSPTRARCAITAETIAKAIGGHRAGATWMARCPVHDVPRDPESDQIRLREAATFRFPAEFDFSLAHFVAVYLPPELVENSC